MICRVARWSFPRTVRLAFIPVLCQIGLGCGDDDGGTKPPVDPAPPCGRILVVTTDFFESGAVAVVDADSSFRAYPDLASVHSDAVVRLHGGLVYVVNRLGGDNVQVLDPADGFRTLRQFSVGPGTNPHDIAFLEDGRAYVSRYGSTSLLEVDPRDGTVRASIDLSPLADPDGIPDMSRLFLRGGFLYAALQRIDFGGGTYAPVPPSILAVIDTRDNTLVDADAVEPGIQGIILSGLNPTAPMVWSDTLSRLMVPCSGAYGVLDGGIELVDLEGQRSDGWLIREETLGGDLIDFAIADFGRGFATISDPSFVTSLVAFDPDAGVRLETLYRSTGYELADLFVTVCGHLLVCDRNYEAPGLRVFDARSGAVLAGVAQPISTGLPPFELVAIEEPQGP